MAHELAFTENQADMLSVLKIPWHRQGHVLARAPSLDEALGMCHMLYT